jgi:hypothetical protein
MNRYHFILYGDRPYQEPDGTVLTSDAAAVAHAARIARELKAGHRIASRDWVIAVRQGEREIEVIDFATVQ